MDIRMPVLDGIEATRRIVRDGAGADARVLILTTFDADENVVEALRAGASGFLLKDVTPADLVVGDPDVAAGDALLAPAVTRRLLDRYRGPPAAGQRRAQRRRLRDLTEREIEVLKLVGRGPLEPRDRRAAGPCRTDRQDPRLARSSTSSSCATGRRPSCSPTRPGWSGPAPIDRRGMSRDRYHGMS